MITSFRLSRATVAVFALVAMASLTACGGDNASKSNADLLKDAAANMKAAKTYHMDVDANSGGQQVKMNGDIDLVANNVKLSMTASGQSVEMVKVGTDAYMSLDGGKTYTKTDAASAPDPTSFTDMWSSLKPEDIDKAKDALKDGNPATEKIDGTDTKHMTGDAKDLSALGSTGGSTITEGTIDIWVTTDAKPTIRQMKIVGKDSTGSDINGTLQWSNIDAPVTITAPPTSLKLGLPVLVASPQFRPA